MEGGTSINSPTVKHFYAESEKGWTYYYGWKGTVKSMPSYYIKLGVEKAFELCPKSQVSFPISLSYFNQREKLEMDGGEWGCFGGFGGHRSIIRNNHIIAFSTGIKLISNPTEKISFQNSINFSPNLNVCSENKVKDISEEGAHEYYNASWLNNIFASFNLQSGLFYTLSPKIKIGITGEYYFFNKKIVPQNGYPNQYDCTHDKRFVLFNFGLRLQKSF